MNTPDIMPTLLSLLKLPIPAQVEGMDLAHCALDGPGPVPAAALLQNTGCADWIDGHEWRALRDQRYTYGIFRVDRSEKLFDRLTDPLEMKNLAGEPSAAPIIERFRKMLAARMEALNDHFEYCHVVSRPLDQGPDNPAQGQGIVQGAFLWVHRIVAHAGPSGGRRVIRSGGRSGGWIWESPWTWRRR